MATIVATLKVKILDVDASSTAEAMNTLKTSLFFPFAYTVDGHEYTITDYAICPETILDSQTGEVSSEY